MFQKFRKSKMSSVEFIPTTKMALSSLVKLEARRVGSRTVAFENVARVIGISSSWVRKYITYDDAVADPRGPMFLRIREYYSDVCARIEAENREDELKLRQLKGELDALSEGFTAESGK